MKNDIHEFLVDKRNTSGELTQEEWLDLNTDAFGNCYSDADPGL